MKVLLYMPYTAFPSANGFQTVPYNLLQGLLKTQDMLARKDLDIVLFSDNNPSYFKSEFSISSNIKIVTFRNALPVTFFSDLQNFTRIIGHNKILSNFSLIHSHNIHFTSTALKTFKKPIFHNFHGLSWKEKRYTSSYFARFSSDVLSRKVKGFGSPSNLKFICISPYVALEIKKYLDASEEKMYVIPDPVSEDFYRVQKDETAGLIFYPARLIPRKNHCSLIKSLVILKERGFSEFTLALTGNPEDLGYYRSLRQLIQKSGLENNVVFYGQISRNKLLYLYSKASIVALTSLEESFSLSMAEAMATGTPVVASPVGVVPDAIETGKNGFVIDPLNPQDIAEKIYILLSDDRLRRNMGKAAKEVAMQWMPQKVAYRLIDLWAHEF